MEPYKRPGELKPETMKKIGKVCLIVVVLLAIRNPEAGIKLFVTGLFLYVVVDLLKGAAEKSQKNKEDRASWLEPKIIEIPHSSQAVFSKIREVLRESVYNSGDKWKVTTPDVQTNRIFAEMRLRGKEKDEGGYVSMEARMEDLPSGHSMLRLVFNERSEIIAWDEGSTMRAIIETREKLMAALSEIVE
jgi:hypothetical protein